MANVDKARIFAIKTHGKQLYGLYPYALHLAWVEEVLKRHGCSEDDLLAAAWLHDIMEDCGVSFEYIAKRFGSQIAKLVSLVSDMEGRSRAERKRNTYTKLVACKEPRALALKLADRIANIEACREEGSNSLLRMYQKEHPDFAEMFRQAHKDDLACALWNTYSTLIFK